MTSNASLATAHCDRIAKLNEQLAAARAIIEQRDAEIHVTILIYDKQLAERDALIETLHEAVKIAYSHQTPLQPNIRDVLKAALESHRRGNMNLQTLPAKGK